MHSKIFSQTSKLKFYNFCIASFNKATINWHQVLLILNYGIHTYEGMTLRHESQLTRKIKLFTYSTAFSGILISLWRKSLSLEDWSPSQTWLLWWYEPFSDDWMCRAIRLTRKSRCKANGIWGKYYDYNIVHTFFL